jgi:putative hydrolase of HD superfamily
MLNKIVNFLFEIEILKRIKRAGWKRVGIENSDSVAEHAFCTAQIAYILAEMEKANAQKAVLIALFHDNGEARVGDLDLVAKLYLKDVKGEEKSFSDQIKKLPGEREIQQLFKEWKEQKTKEAIVARDADLLEGAIQAKFYLTQGNKLLDIWIKHFGSKLKTKSAKKIFRKIVKAKIDEWWKEIPEIKKEIQKLK